ncbi:MAG: DUF454 family protein [Adlercreutzia equolifaciens]
MTIKRYLYAGLGLLFLGLGGIGVIIPIIPTTPFLLLTSFFFLRSSERLNTWFEGTRMYKRFIANFMETRSLTLRAKILCAAPGVTAMPMLALVVPQWWLKAILIGLTVFEIWYFIARIETVSVEEARARAKPASPRRSATRLSRPLRRRGSRPGGRGVGPHEDRVCDGRSERAFQRHVGDGGALRPDCAPLAV